MPIQPTKKSKRPIPENPRLQRMLFRSLFYQAATEDPSIAADFERYRNEWDKSSVNVRRSRALRLRDRILQQLGYGDANAIARITFLLEMKEMLSHKPGEDE